jgi:acylphosphatase
MDGSVEAVVQGPADAIERITLWARRGPEQAHVDRVDVSDTDGDFQTFDKRPTE